MGAHVYRQVAGLRESLAAGGAGVGPVSSMGALLIFQIVGPRESLAAGDASVEAVSGMGAHVPRQVAGLREGLAGDRALDNVDLVPRRTAPPLAGREQQV